MSKRAFFGDMAGAGDFVKEHCDSNAQRFADVADCRSAAYSRNEISLSVQWPVYGRSSP
jgi:hypothetical protein